MVFKIHEHCILFITDIYLILIIDLTSLLIYYVLI